MFISYISYIFIFYVFINIHIILYSYKIFIISKIYILIIQFMIIPYNIYN